MERRFVVLPTRAEVEARVAAELCREINSAIGSRGRADVVVTGGTVGIGILAALRHLGAATTVEWPRVHVWWGDERFVPAGDPDRNDKQATDALLAHVTIPSENLHAFPADTGQSVEAARDDFLAHYASGFPLFDVALNGIGPDGHAASLFPGRDRGDSEEVIAVRDSPKLPPERLSFTLRVLNHTRNVWIVASGSDKGDAIKRIAEDSPESVTPAAALRGREDTVVWLDADAASLLPG